MDDRDYAFDFANVILFDENETSIAEYVGALETEVFHATNDPTLMLCISLIIGRMALCGVHWVIPRNSRLMVQRTTNACHQRVLLELINSHASTWS